MNLAGRTNSPKVKTKYKDEIILIKRANPSLSGAKIQQALERAYPNSKYIPQKRTIEKVIQTNKHIWENMKPSELDQPWSIGICEKYNIPSDIVPVLIECEKMDGKKLTIREARWVAKLKPAVYEMVKRDFPNRSPLGYLTTIAYQYSHKEKICELTGSDIDTSELDRDIFYKTRKDDPSVGLGDVFGSHENNTTDK